MSTQRRSTIYNIFSNFITVYNFGFNYPYISSNKTPKPFNYFLTKIRGTGCDVSVNRDGSCKHLLQCIIIHLKYNISQYEC